MRKIEYRKLAMVAMTFALVGFLAACSGSSSTDDPLAHPGNVMGQVRFDVDPAAGTVNVTPVGSPFSSNTIVGVGNPNVTISTNPATVVWNGSNTIDFDVTIKWNDLANELRNVRIGATDSTDLGVSLTNGDKCGATAWSACPISTNDSAIAWVSDLDSDTPETQTICQPGPINCETSSRRIIHAGCGQVTAHWTLQNAGTGYTFWATLYGDTLQTGNLLADPYYDPYTASIYLRPKKLGAGTLYPAAGAESKTMASGEWFYVSYSVDAPGNGAAFGFDPDLINGPKHIEDTGNIAAWAGGTSSTAVYWFVGSTNPSGLRWDNAVVEANSNNAADPPTAGAAKWLTAGGTKLNLVNDPTGTTAATAGVDGHNVLAETLYSYLNTQGVYKSFSSGFAAGSSFYPNPCGDKAVNPNVCNAGYDGYANLDWHYNNIVLHVKTGLPVGTGSFIEGATDTNQGINAFRTDGGPGSAAAWQVTLVPKSLNWPNWCVILPNSGCEPGLYNQERSYVCVQ